MIPVKIIPDFKSIVDYEEEYLKSWRRITDNNHSLIVQINNYGSLILFLERVKQISENIYIYINSTVAYSVLFTTDDKEYHFVQLQLNEIMIDKTIISKFCVNINNLLEIINKRNDTVAFEMYDSNSLYITYFDKEYKVDLVDVNFDIPLIRPSANIISYVKFVDFVNMIENDITKISYIQDKDTKNSYIRGTETKGLKINDREINLMPNSKSVNKDYNIESNVSSKQLLLFDNFINICEEINIWIKQESSIIISYYTPGSKIHHICKLIDDV